MVSSAPAGVRLAPSAPTENDKEKRKMLKGFKNFLMQGDLIIIAVGLVVALAFSTLIKAFTDSVITPLINAAGGGGAGANGLGWTINGQRIDLGAFIAAIVYFLIFMAVIYLVLVVPYRSYMKRRGTSVFGDPDPTKVCPSCLSDGLPLAATKCKFCASEVPVTT
jgi:large conductance mechanosensitive channel